MLAYKKLYLSIIVGVEKIYLSIEYEKIAENNLETCKISKIRALRALYYSFTLY